MKASVVLGLACGVSATTLHRRDAAKILSDLDDISGYVKQLGSAISKFTVNGDLGSLTKPEAALDSAIKSATTDAKNTSPVGEADAAKVLNAVSDLIPIIVDTLNEATDKADVFAKAAGGISPLVTTLLNTLKTDTDAFAAALIKLAPSADKAAASAAIGCIDSAFKSGIATKSASAACTADIKIPSGGSGSSGETSSAPTKTSGGSGSSETSTSGGSGSSETSTSGGLGSSETSTSGGSGSSETSTSEPESATTDSTSPVTSSSDSGSNSATVSSPPESTITSPPDESSSLSIVPVVTTTSATGGGGDSGSSGNSPPVVTASGASALQIGTMFGAVLVAGLAFIL